MWYRYLPAWLTEVVNAGSEGIEAFSFDLAVSYTHEEWRGRIRASAGVAASLSEEGVERFDSELAGLLAGRFPEDPLHVPYRMSVVISRSPV